MRQLERDKNQSRSDALVQRWIDGRATLREVRGYTDQELYAMARVGYVYYYQGKVEQARVVFQGLYAVDPLNAYFARALGVVEFAAGNPKGALAAYDAAIKLAPQEPGALVGRAEVRLAGGQRSLAIDDLRQASGLATEDDPLRGKILAMLRSLTGR
jgi:type III secretion system low calcium response chaperone LcrH/SycD